VILERSATISARLTTRGGATSFRFEYGPTTSYGQSTTVGTLAAGPPDRTVTAALEALTPGTVYHFRVIAWNKHGTSTGDDRSFTTTSAVTPPLAGPDANAGVGDDSGPTNDDMSMPSSTAAPEPQLGRSMVVAPVQGTIKVKLPDTPGYATLAAGDSVPVGTLVDTRHGTVKLTSALGAGTTQTGEFRGALFQVRQSRARRAMTDIVLRGGSFGQCRPTSHDRRDATIAASRRTRPARRLWARDRNGRFRTHGRNSVATVHGTSWVTTDTCAGTRTRVTEGAVAVRDRHRHRTVLVRAGHSYLARNAR
jgi:hypothetical protein